MTIREQLEKGNFDGAVKATDNAAISGVYQKFLSDVAMGVLSPMDEYKFLLWLANQIIEHQLKTEQ